MLWTCPICDDLYDADGYWEHGYEVLYLCKCGVILNKQEDVVPPERVDMQGLENQDRGLFIKASRLVN